MVDKLPARPHRQSPDVWPHVLAYLRQRSAGLVRSWFPDLTPLGIDRGEFTIQTTEPGQLRYLSERCRRAFVDALQAVTGRLVGVRFLGPAGQPLTATPDVSDTPGDDDLKLNPDFTFENFVTGPCNRLAHAAAVAVSESPGQGYNPLFIHAGAGLGKTHLLHAICHRLLDRDPGRRVALLPSESFVNHFIEAVEHGTLPAFRQRYRTIDLLILDDVQFLATRERSQEEFFHTFNALFQEQRQLVLTANCAPLQIPGLEERLTSRFNWGLLARIEAPCLETRLALLRKKARLRGLDLPDDVAQLIAARVDRNSRELEGALARLRGAAELQGGRIDTATAEAALDDGNTPDSRRIRVDEIISAITSQFDVRTADLQGRRRSRSVALPRQICMHLARRLTGHSLEEIGGFFGGRDHSTVLHADRVIARRRADDPHLRATLDQIETELRRGVAS